MKLNQEFLNRLVGSILTTRPDEIDCGECYHQLDVFAEVQLAGKSPGEALPLVQEHLDRCKDCCQEYEALLVAIQALA